MKRSPPVVGVDHRDLRPDQTDTAGLDEDADWSETTLDEVGHQRQVRLAGLDVVGRRRRPSGERPPLPRELKASGKFWIAAGVAITAIWIGLFAFPQTREWWNQVDLDMLNWFVELRNDPATEIMRALHALGSSWIIRPLRWITILVLVRYRRWRTLAGALLAYLLVFGLVYLLAYSIARPRPFVEMIGDWQGWSHPSLPVATLAVTLTVVGLALVPRGQWRQRWFVAAAVLISALGVARMYLGVDHPSDVWIGALLGPAIAVIVFKLFVPESIWPVSYDRGSKAHLDISGVRGQAIRTALREQLGIVVAEIEPFGQEGSGGSTPLRIKAEGEEDVYLFAKLYARSHLRSDRWYKVARTILYGSLEDEIRFQSVRRLVEYEDYMLLLLSRAGLPSPRPLGFVEITPEREYMIVTEFIDGAREMGDANVSDEVIDNALQVVRQMWDAGLAHRDIKPANVLVRDSEIVLIDPAFATVRPSAWRQAVDLANMMLILALRTSPERVYDRALRFFSPDDIAEAFAASHSVTIPSQSRSSLNELKKRLGVDIIARFKELAPTRPAISIQRWSRRRVFLTVGALFVFMLVISLVIDNIRGIGFI